MGLLLGFTGATVWAWSADAAPLDALRSIWVTEDNTWIRSNPAYLARTGRLPRAEVEVGHHLLVQSVGRESTAWAVTGYLRIPLACGAMQIEGQRVGTDFNLLFDHGRLSSQAHRPEYLNLSYGIPLGRYFDVGIMAQTRPSASRLEGDVGLRFYPRDEWRADVYLRRSSMDRFSTIQFKDERIELQSRAHYAEQGFALQGAISPRLIVVLLSQQGGLKPDTRRDGYALDMEGDWRLLKGSWKGQLRPRFALLGNVRYRRLEGQPEGHLGGRGFSRGQLDFADMAGSLWLRYSRNGVNYVDLGYLSGYGQGELRWGRLESWPFINSFASLLGGKEWSGWGRADFRMAGGGMRLDQRVGAWRIGTDTRLLRVWSGLFATTRERKKLDFSTLFFPRTYREEGDIQADALDLRIRLEYRLSRWGVRYGFAQIVPLRVESSFELGDGEREGSGGREHRLVLFFLRGCGIL